MRSSLTAFLTGVVLLTSAMFWPAPALRVPNAVAFTAPEKYRALHAEAEACTGAHRDYDQITWLTVPGVNFRVPGKTGPVIGYWVQPDSIYLSEAWTTTDWVPKHEMIHDLLQHDHFEGDTAVWGSACHAMWGFLSPDTVPSLPGITSEGPKVPTYKWVEPKQTKVTTRAPLAASGWEDGWGF